MIFPNRQNAKVAKNPIKSPRKLGVIKRFLATLAVKLVPLYM
jgi:hypothetical protein